jgi:hypothetical protein
MPSEKAAASEFAHLDNLAKETVVSVGGVDKRETAPTTGRLAWRVGVVLSALTGAALVLGLCLGLLLRRPATLSSATLPPALFTLVIGRQALVPVRGCRSANKLTRMCSAALSLQPVHAGQVQGHYHGQRHFAGPHSSHPSGPEGVVPA